MGGHGLEQARLASDAAALADAHHEIAYRVCGAVQAVAELDDLEA
jgi:hypothetical protein